MTGIIEVEMPDGSIAEFPAGTSREVMTRAIKKRFGAQQSPAPSGQISTYLAERAKMPVGAGRTSDDMAVPMSEDFQAARDAGTIAANPIAARNDKFVQGLPLVGEWTDEAVGLVSPQGMAAVRARREAMDRQRPRESMALQIGGGVVGGGAAIAAAPALGLGRATSAATNYIGRAKGPLGAAWRTAVAGGAAGAVEGTASGAGRAEAGNRVKGGVTGGAIGTAFGAVLGPVAAGLGMGVANLAKRIKGLDVSVISDAFGIDKSAARTVREALINDDLDAAAARLGMLGDDAMLADAGPATASLLDAATKTGGKALATATRAVEGRATAMGQRLSPTLDSILSATPKGQKATARAIAQETSAARSAAYKAAYSAPINYADNTGAAIESVLARVPSRQLNAAIQEANEAMQAEGIRNAQVMAKIADDGSVSFMQMPNVQQLDYIKKALGDVAKRETDDFGRLNSAGLRAQKLAADLRDAIAEAVPSYRTALRLGGDKLQQDEALALGQGLLTQKVKVEDVVDFMRRNKGMSQEAREAAIQGVRSSIDETLGNVRRTITDPNTDAREAMKLVAEISSRNNIAKVRLVLGPKKAEQLLSELDKQATALALRAAVGQNSMTAIRQAIQGQVKDNNTPHVALRTLGNLGNPLDAAKEVTQTIAGIDARSISNAQKAEFAQIADALTRIRGPEAQRALVLVRKAINGQPLKDEEARLIGRATSGAAFSGGLQALEGILTPQQ